MSKRVKLTGRVEDFNGNPLEGATVRLDNHRFTPVVEVLTDEKGCYEIEVEPGLYHDIFICKDYGVHNLEYWAWDVPLFADMVVNARINGLEIYSFRAFRVRCESMVFLQPFTPLIKFWKVPARVGISMHISFMSAMNRAWIITSFIVSI
ncbi:carboxypeptidase-like regulatory domain-containing protein [Paenibacillus sp. 1001270B_150601_E10]|uniref:carboxypeptidase-like regulatory domain-containing protein n=1 Tax=Paenibacillus sp. 1001270B_150601_E10 TaxID=2787079 RepID=UPI00189F92FB|nr:carboxypeptidase-like regulatory domain-containing protein [Paenibacillus sp. 1001270B_150601_E10]